ncbi:MAG: choice-of-anchor D domain-containing protein [Myxococcaceae bacterium]|nr:choice-of-anchor D domain-containing protein [Myxococcaceae bacterium]
MRTLSFSIFVALIAGGCDCRKNGGPGTTFAELGVVWRDGNGNEVVDRDATYDFGAAFVGERVTKQLIVRNVGGAPLTLAALTHGDGVTVSIGADKKENSYFEVDFTPPVDVAATGEVTFQMAFTPRTGVKNPVARLLLRAEGTAPGEAEATITLRAVGEGGACELPTEINFGEVPLGETFKLGHTFNNPASVIGTANVSAITGADATSFGSNVTGDAQVEPMGMRAVEFSFSPTELREYEARVTLKGTGDCPAGEVVLKGKGADSVLTWTPQRIDYGYVSVNVETPREITFTNRSNAPIRLTNIRSDYADFIYLPPAGDTNDTFTVAGGGESKLRVACKPSSLGPRSARFTFDTGLVRQPNGVIDLVCTGGGPNIRVTPRPTLNFGRVGFFPGSSTYTVQRKVSVQNVGTRPLDMNVNANLHLGQVVGGVPGGFPLVAITPTNATTAMDEFEIGLPGNYNRMTGLPAIAGQNVADLLITLKPQSLGAKAADLTIYSNDPNEPVIVVKLTAEATQLPPCNLQISPSALNFGLITPPDTKDLGIQIKNLGSGPNDTCFLTGLEVAAGSDPAFSLVGGPIDEKEMQPGETLTAVVRAAPVVPGTQTMTQSLVGTFRFNVADPMNPSRTVPLQASVGPICLTVVPGSFNFGNVKKDCNTAAREFTIYNTCSGDIYLRAPADAYPITMQAAAGQQAGGPNCPGGAPCPEFVFTSTPVVPPGGLILGAGDATSFRVKYRPIDYGPDTGAVAIQAIQTGVNVTYLVSLSGVGDMDGLQTDTFQQSQTPKADVLVVIDNSCSMGDKQTSLGANFSAFLTYAQSTMTDWQLGVTTSDAPAGSSQCPPPPFPCITLPTSGQRGGFLIGDDPMTNPNGNPRILLPTTPGVAAKFNSKVQVGTNGADENPFEASVKALTPPLITAENAGFLRPDANLAIVVITDAGDQSTLSGQTYSYYMNRLRNVKGYQNANMFTFNVIGPFGAETSSCLYDDYTNSVTLRDAARETSGVEYEICAPDWAMKLQDLGKTAFGFRTVFYLSAEPDFSGGRNLVVKINGVTVPATSYTYRPMTLSIEFTPMTTPGPGQTLTVEYYKACL